jgi:hypothetical protein
LSVTQAASDILSQSLSINTVNQSIQHPKLLLQRHYAGPHPSIPLEGNVFIVRLTILSYEQGRHTSKAERLGGTRYDVLPITNLGR